MTKGWSTVSIRNALDSKLEEVVEKKIDPSITSKTQLLDLAVREYVKKIEDDSVGTGGRRK